ncbi:tRNA uridine-5-carboxymethylaminomethyl(34) synthesis GTPase MnmE [Consotaella salsifontis]|uniref:tRNA modification GTPase MnmE n=1 Tax=Consotaella salsifontis TaxID=1365950 RepID=A0A1T4T5D3_9HYPH|nr:tRNA uridine-5-carboxymethylaminomethyl(34) synthesis GTPase MnmE [Consotaella salsifontis]SKA35471.1 tRNA modification GTPase trmE [Consotaella salsifontis]
MDKDTIVALSSGALPAGIAVVRMSGPVVPMALAIIAGSVPEPRRASLKRIRDGAGETIDHGIVLYFPGPSSVTGEDIGEIHLHGGRAVVDACLSALIALPGVRLAEAGEFTRRAFDNGRIDLTEAEGLADLLAAQTESQRRAAVAQAGGILRELCEEWMRRLTHARAFLEASFDFSDEGDVEADVAGNVRADMATLAADMRHHLNDARRGEILRSGFRVAIVGRPNVGKSSLLNALAERDVAIVSDIPGTTRDVLEVTLDLKGLPVRLFDTAGLRETEDRIEAAGVERARRAMAEADLVLLLDDGQEEAVDPLIHVKQTAGLFTPDADGARSPALIVRSKCDLPLPSIEAARSAELCISTRTGEGLDALIEAIAGRAERAVGDRSTLVPLRIRHRAIIAEALEALETFLSGEDLPEEVGAEMLRLVSDRLGALTGRIGVEDILGVIFSEFCIGK